MKPESGSNPLATPQPWNDIADGYAKEMQPILEPYANDAIDLVGGCYGAKVLDVACGPGTLSALLQSRAQRVDAIDFSPGMIRKLSQFITNNGASNIFPQCMDGQDLSFPDMNFDFSFSMFGLMLFPDRLKGMAEMFRVLRPGGRCAISSWTHIERSPLLNAILDTVAAITGQPIMKNTQSVGIDDPAIFEDELQNAGFHDITIHLVSHTTQVESVHSFWSFMKRSAAPIALLQRACSNDEWNGMELIANEYLKNALPDLPATLGTEAFIGIGTKSV